MKVDMKAKTPFRALTVAGSDSGGCAGIQADLKTFSALGVFGMSAITALTSQNTLGVSHIMPVTAESLATQIDAVLSDIGADAIKTGMLFSAELVRVTADRLRHWDTRNLAVDPVMVSSTGAVLLREDAISAMVDEIFPLAAVITPNIPEAELLTGMKIASLNDMKHAAEKLIRHGSSNVLIKGGHSAARDSGKAVDILFDGSAFHEFEGEWIDTKNLHGTGCTFSAAIAAYLARGLELKESIKEAKIYITNAIKGGACMKIGAGNGPVDHFHNGAHRMR